MTTQFVAQCGCPIPPEVASGEVESLGWHLTKNHPEVRMTTTTGIPLRTPFGTVRQPTAEECKFVGRDTSYSAEPYAPISDWRDLGDYVIETSCEADTKATLAEACEQLGMCDAAHVIPAGVYLEE
jgi:hypothetical protein